jgi:hypothetical protein
VVHTGGPTGTAQVNPGKMDRQPGERISLPSKVAHQRIVGMNGSNGRKSAQFHGVPLEPIDHLVVSLPDRTRLGQQGADIGHRIVLEQPALHDLGVGRTWTESGDTTEPFLLGDFKLDRFACKIESVLSSMQLGLESIIPRLGLFRAVRQAGAATTDCSTTTARPRREAPPSPAEKPRSTAEMRSVLGRPI